LLAHFGSVGVFDLLENLERGFSVSDGLSAVAEFVERESFVKERVAFSTMVTYLASDRQLLFVELDGPLPYDMALSLVSSWLNPPFKKAR